ncbi:hypothetical protein OROHE_018683 [Orobanche hederae]
MQLPPLHWYGLARMQFRFNGKLNIKLSQNLELIEEIEIEEREEFGATYAGYNIHCENDFLLTMIAVLGEQFMDQMVAYRDNLRDDDAFHFVPEEVVFENLDDDVESTDRDSITTQIFPDPDPEILQAFLDTAADEDDDNGDFFVPVQNNVEGDSSDDHQEARDDGANDEQADSSHDDQADSSHDEDGSNDEDGSDHGD